MNIIKKWFDEYQTTTLPESQQLTIIDFLTTNGDKALLIQAGQGVWYYYQSKLMRIYKNMCHETCFLSSILLLNDDNNKIDFMMDNGMLVSFIYKETLCVQCFNYLISYQPSNYEWIKPLTPEEIKNFTL